MDQQQLRHWENSIDAADSSPITANLPPDAETGSVFTDAHCSDGVERTWVRVRIITGSVGARWAYWLNWTNPLTGQPGIGPHAEHKVVADRIFNGDANHFVGMLGVPFAGKMSGVESRAWVLVHPKPEGPRVVHVQEDRLGKERYEKSKEVHDVETGVTKVLP